MSKTHFTHGNKINQTHGHRISANGSSSATYVSWRAMRSRCLNVNSSDYSRYGGRGIKICRRWDKFENFLKDMGERPEGKTLDRINNNGDYKPSNCRWANRSQQQRNKNKYKYPKNFKCSRNIEFNGAIKSLSEWSRFLNISKQALRYRLKNWSIDDALRRIL